ncbi:hypothetical protein OY671_010807, partial [Metschnikowia pulcherrima]
LHPGQGRSERHLRHSGGPYRRAVERSGPAGPAPPHRPSPRRGRGRFASAVPFGRGSRAPVRRRTQPRRSVRARLRSSALSRGIGRRGLFSRRPQDPSPRRSVLHADGGGWHRRAAYRPYGHSRAVAFHPWSVGAASRQPAGAHHRPWGSMVVARARLAGRGARRFVVGALP